MPATSRADGVHGGGGRRVGEAAVGDEHQGDGVTGVIGEPLGEELVGPGGAAAGDGVVGAVLAAAWRRRGPRRPPDRRPRRRGRRGGAARWPGEVGRASRHHLRRRTSGRRTVPNSGGGEPGVGATGQPVQRSAGAAGRSRCRISSRISRSAKCMMKGTVKRRLAADAQALHRLLVEDRRTPSALKWRSNSGRMSSSSKSRWRGHVGGELGERGHEVGGADAVGQGLRRRCRTGPSPRRARGARRRCGRPWSAATGTRSHEGREEDVVLDGVVEQHLGAYPCPVAGECGHTCGRLSGRIVAAAAARASAPPRRARWTAR